jgi:hypothetical protein
MKLIHLVLHKSPLCLLVEVYNDVYYFFYRSSGEGLKLTTHLFLVPRPRMVELCLHSPICLHGTEQLYLLLFEYGDVYHNMLSINTRF